MNANKYQQLAARTLLDKPDREYSHNEIMLADGYSANDSINRE